MVAYECKGRWKNMLGKLFGATFMFRAFSFNACSYICCDHDGDVWDN